MDQQVRGKDEDEGKDDADADLGALATGFAKEALGEAALAAVLV